MQRKRTFHVTSRIVMSSFCLLGLSVTQYAQAQVPASPVVVAPVIERQVRAEEVFVGTVMPSKRAVIGSAVDGRVVDFPRNAGDRVEAGQTLASLLTETVELELAAAEAELDLRQQKLAELENGARPQEIDEAKARLAAAKARREYLRTHRERTEKAFKRGNAATADELDSAISQDAEAEQNMQEAQSALDLLVAGPRPEQIAQARAAVAVQQAVVGQLRDRIAKHTIISRFTGYLVTEYTENGQWLKKGDPVAEVAALDNVEIEVQVVERSVPYVKIGDPVPVEFPALENRILPGKVIAVVPQADVRARTFPVKIGVENTISDSGPLIKAGMYARATLPTGNEVKAMLVPKDALVLGGEKPTVFKLVKPAEKDESAQVAPVPVDLGVATDQWIQVIGPLQAGDKVIVQGNERLRPGATVKVVRTIEPLKDETKDKTESSAGQ